MIKSSIRRCYGLRTSIWLKNGGQYMKLTTHGYWHIGWRGMLCAMKWWKFIIGHNNSLHWHFWVRLAFFSFLGEYDLGYSWFTCQFMTSLLERGFLATKRSRWTVEPNILTCLHTGSMELSLGWIETGRLKNWKHATQA